jgi:DNA polymerase III subunit delta
MPIYLYWGDDEFAIAQAVTALQRRSLDPQWVSFNYNKLSAEQSDATVTALNFAMTPVFGAGHRLVWLADSTLCQQCPEPLLLELERTLPVLPETSIFLITHRNKPDSRLKVTKLLQKFADVREFTLIPPWKTDLLTQQVQQAASDLNLHLTAEAVDLVVEAVGNDTRRLFQELEKLAIYASDRTSPLSAGDVSQLVHSTTQNSLQLAAAIRQRQIPEALALVSALFQQNEPALRIVATLVGQFRTWLWVKVMIESGERDEAAIAKAAEIGNPKRIYFLRQEVKLLSSTYLKQALCLLFELELSLKQGSDEISTLQTKVIELCSLK